MSRFCRIGLGVLFCVSITVSPAAAAIYDLTTVAGSSATINGAVYLQGRSDSGTGNFPSFVQVGANQDIVAAYNTNTNMNGPTLFNGSSDQHNFAITVGDLTTSSNGQFYVFSLDINENNGTGGQGGDADKYVSLDEIRIFVGGTANGSSQIVPTNSSDPAFGTLVYRMDFGASGQDNTVGLNFNLATGSGSSDMFLFVPVSAFGGALSTAQVIFYSQFGALGSVVGAGNTTGLPDGNYGNSDGFEEWANQGFTLPQQEPPPLPEPATALIWSLGGLAMAFGYRLRSHRARAA